MHEDGFSIIDSIKIIRELYSVRLADADYIVSSHPIWSNIVRTSPLLRALFLDVESDGTYSDWLRINRFGLDRTSWIAPVEDQERLQETKQVLQEVLHANNEEQARLLAKIVHITKIDNDMLPVLLALLNEVENALAELIVRVIADLGFPQNEGAIPLLIDRATFSTPGVRDAATSVLMEMDTQTVAPYFMAILLYRIGEDKEWVQSINALFQLLQKKHAWIIACGPALAYLLARCDYAQDERPDIDALLELLGRVPQACTYAIPALYRTALAGNEKASGRKAREILANIDQSDIYPYRYRLADLDGSGEEKI